MNLWYQERFGYAIERYRSSADAIATFPTTATAVGVRRIHGEFECCAPFGLDDLFGLVVRPNKRQNNTVHLRGESRAVAFYLAWAEHPAVGREGHICYTLIIFA